MLEDEGRKAEGDEAEALQDADKILKEQTAAEQVPSLEDSTGYLQGWNLRIINKLNKVLDLTSSSFPTLFHILVTWHHLAVFLGRFFRV